MNCLQQSLAGNEVGNATNKSPDVIQTLGIGLNEKRKFGGAPPKAKIRSFKPSMHNGRLELSTFCLDGLDESARWQLLDEHSNKSPIPGRAELSVDDISSAELDIDADWDPERHVNVIGWPKEEERQRSCQQVLLASQAFYARK